MSIKTIRKRIAVTASTALLAGALSVIAVPSAQANHPNAGTANLTNYSGNVANAPSGTAGSLFVATTSNTGTSAAVATTIDTETTEMTATCNSLDEGALSKGLLSKDTSSGIAQSATVLAGGVLSIYSCVATAVSFQASGGSFVAYGANNTGWSYSSNNSKVWSPTITVAAGTGVAALWTAPSTAGTYTVSLYSGFYTDSNGASVIATSSNAATPPTLTGNITVSVVASSAGGSYAATNSFCKAVVDTTTAPANNVDDSGVNKNGDDWSIDFALRDAYNRNLPASGAIVATATNGALLAFGTAGSTPVAGTASTIVTTGAGDNNTVRVSQKTAGAPITTTVTITYNGTTVCTKTVSIAGTVAALTIPAANIAVQALSGSTGSAAWFSDGTARTGTFYVVATDSVGNRIATPSTLGTYGFADGSTGTTVTNITFDNGDLASTSDSTSPLSATVGSHTCAAKGGTQTGAKITFTLANGTVITSSPINLSCADDAATYTASFDKAKYVSGDVAKLTISFKNTDGTAANNITALGTSTIAVPGMTLVSTTGVASAVTAAGGKVEYTYTVGQTAGKYAAVIDFKGTTALATYRAVQNPSYEITSGGDTTTNADVLKSIVALIASINKQIQALQKLILKR
jgi:hypothetical protein